MNSYCRGRNLTSLLSLSIEYIVRNLSKLNRQDLESLHLLPEHVRNRMLHKFTVTSFYWRRIDIYEILKLLTHKMTQHIDLTSFTLDNKMLEVIHPCENLQKLYLTSGGDDLITTEGLLKLIPQLKRIKFLRISNSKAVTDNVLECVAENCKVINGIDVGGCKQITDKALEALSCLTVLLWLTFSKTQVTDLGIDYLVRGPSGTHLKELRLADCPGITEKVLNSIAVNCPDLMIFVFNNCSKVQDQTCFSFQEGSLKNLKQINWTIEW